MQQFITKPGGDDRAFIIRLAINTEFVATLNYCHQNPEDFPMMEKTPGPTLKRQALENHGGIN
jgi:hypothetical protein